MSQNKNKPVISFVITVFNKEKYLPAMLDSILRQSEKLNCEYIFVDDASIDNSVQVIKKAFNKSQNLTIITNKQNMGPAIRLNQGCTAASGQYLFLMDADDILAKNALDVMLNAIKTESADFIFGGHRVTEKTQSSLLDAELPVNTRYQVSTEPLDTVLKNRYVRMAYLITRELFLKSNGADEKIFIQDESLPLRLAYHAQKMITLNNPAVYAAKKDKSLSDNKLQQIHDRFYAYYYALLEFKKLSGVQKTGIYRRAFSCIWKAKRTSPGLMQKLFFIAYLRSRVLPLNVNIKNLDQYKNFMDNLKNVRKVL